MNQRLKLFSFLVFSVVATGCSLLPGNKTSEVVYAPTEIGTPVGDKVTRQIGPAGGTLSSGDGRLTLTIPPSAVSETVTFAVAPITNKAAGGIGNAYRLEPDGRTFATPLELSLRYDDNDLDGTAAEALAIAFQDKAGKWHVLDPTGLDDANRSVKFAVTHFTDFSFLATMRLEPPKATLRVGETMQIKLIGCGEPGIFQFPHPGACVMGHEVVMMEWYTDIGTVTSQMNPANYTAPPRKPNPNVATVSVPYNLPDIRGGWGPNYGEVTPYRRGMFTAKITIVDRGYRATGSAGGMSFSGTVCSLDKPFTIVGRSQLTFNFKFTPASGGTDGTVAIGGGGMGVTLHDGHGTYTVTGTETDSPTIALNADTFKGSYPGVGTAQGSGTRYISLVPLEGNECDGQ